MPRQYEDPRPISQQIAADLRAQILSGDITEALPSFSQLAATFEVSVNTCQNAVQILKEEGLVSGKQGKGLTVHEPDIMVVAAGVYFEPKRGHLKYDLIEVVPVTAPRNVAELLDEDQAILRKQVMLIDGEPAEVIRNYYALSLATGTGLESKKSLVGGAHRVLREIGVEPVRFVDVLSHRQATRDEMRLLQLPAYAAILQTLRATYSVAGPAVEVSVLAKGSHRLAAQYEVVVH